jgi:osmotically-inducible protein OsmY
MADYNQNRRGNYRSSNQDWNEDTGSERNYGNDDRNYGTGTSSYGSRYEGGYGNMNSGRSGGDYNEGSTYRSGQYNRNTDYNTGSYGNYGNQGSYNRQGEYGRESGRDYDRDYYSGGGYADRGRDYGYGGGSTFGEGSFGSSRYGRGYRDYTPGGYTNYGGGSGYGGSNFGGGYGGSSYARNYGSGGYGNNSDFGSGLYSGMGSTYGGYSDRGRSDYERSYGSGNWPDYGRSDYGRSSYGGSRYGDAFREQDRDRGWWDKTTDEVSSWFGDEEAERRRKMDRMRGQHRGRGPKGYTRSDERIKEDINDRLSDDPFIDATEIDVTVTNGEVTLTGKVDDRSDKRRAEDIAEAVSGVINVENRIRVNRETWSTENYRTSGTTGSMAGTTGSTSGTERSKSKSAVTSEVK